MPLFSVIIPTYNRRELLQEALESVWAQTFTDYEVIVVDDGSADGTWEYLQTLGPRVIALRQDNAGPGAARNRGIRQACGKYVAFLDSDDLWFPWTLDTFRMAFTVAPVVSLVSGTSSSEDFREEYRISQKFEYSSCLFDSNIKDMLPVGGTPSVAIKKTTIDQIGGFCHDLINAEDVDMWMRLGVVPGFVRISSPVIYRNRAHDNNISQDLKRNEAGLNMMLRKEQAGLYPGGRQYRAVRINVLSAMFRSTSVDFLGRNDPVGAWHLYRQSFLWQMSQRRYLYVFGFPLLYIRKIISNLLK